MRKKELNSFGRDELQHTTYVIQKLIGKLLNHTDMWIIVNLHKNHGLPYKEIEYVFKHCISRGNRNVSYIEKVAIAYAKKGENALEITNDRAIDSIQKSTSEKSSLKTNEAKPHLPFVEDEIDDGVHIKSIKEQRLANGGEAMDLSNINMRVQVKSELEADVITKALEERFTIVQRCKLNNDTIDELAVSYVDIVVSKKQ
jgi:hypothetical protein